MKYMILLFLLVSSVAKAESSTLTIYAGSGLTSSDIQGNEYYNNNNYVNTHTYNTHGFVMAGEYDFELGQSPFFLGLMAVTSDAFLVSGGIDLAIVSLSAKIGYGLSSPSTDGTELTNLNYGLLVGASAEVRLSPTIGISAAYISNNSYLGGVSFHF
jgi:hypothetical protein